MHILLWSEQNASINFGDYVNHAQSCIFARYDAGFSAFSERKKIQESLNCKSQIFAITLSSHFKVF